MAFPYDMWPNTSGLDTGIAEPRVAATAIVLSIVALMLTIALWELGQSTLSKLRSGRRI